MADLCHIRNFSIIAHIDHGKSTLADRMLELTGTIEKRKMKEQVLDSMELERERGITIKMQPVRMEYHPRGLAPTEPQTSADKSLLYEDLTYEIRGAVFAIRKSIGLGHKETVYQKALEIELGNRGIKFESQKTIDIYYQERKVGTYIPDLVVENKILIELKALPEIGRPQEEQLWSHLKGSPFKLALMVNFGTSDVGFKRIVYDQLREGGGPRHSALSPRESAHIEDVPFILNMIDTPGHIDFSYEVSRSLKAVEGVVLLVDATQGVQAQTFTVLDMARAEGLKIIPVMNKIDLPVARPDEVRDEIAKLLNCPPTEVLSVSGKTGEGVEELLKEIVKRVPPPKNEFEKGERALVFDFEYSTHKGVLVYVRVLDGEIKKGDSLIFSFTREKFIVLETGTFVPQKMQSETLSAGEIGYIVTGIKKAGEAKVGDTITGQNEILPAVPGYMTPRPVVWASMYPESQDDFMAMKQAMERLRLSDSSLSFEEETSGSLGRGFRCGFLGMLHLEIITERLRREFNLELVVATPTISYEAEDTITGRKETIYSPHLFPEDMKNFRIMEPWIDVKIISPSMYLGQIIQLLYDHEAEIVNTETWGDDRTSLDIAMPLRELMRNFFDEVKSVSSGFASFSYLLSGMRQADVVKMDVLIGEEIVPAFSRIVARRRVDREAQDTAERLKNLIPRQLINIKIQVQALGRILAARSISAMRKDVTDYLYGGDITRKMKLREKQKKGKKKMQRMGKVNIPPEVFLKMMKTGEE